MGIFNNLFRRPMAQTSSPPKQLSYAVGADNYESVVTNAFTNKNITFNGDLAGYDYDNILRDKQKNIQMLFQLSDFFVDADPIYRGIIKEVYTPFSIADNFRLVGANEKVKKKYLDHYEQIELKTKMESIFLQYYKYGNVYVYLMENGSLITLPVNQIRISSISVNGEPVLEFDCNPLIQDFTNSSASSGKKFIKDEELKVRLQGFPKEVADGVKKRTQWVQLNPENTYVLQDLKEDWIRYAIPMVASCLPSFAKKELISNYEKALINLGARSFVHVKYGDANHDVLPVTGDLRTVGAIFRKAMTDSGLAVTNCFCSAEVIQPKTDDVFEYDKYKGVNSDILSAGGISGVIVSGRSEDGSTFASAQVSMQTAALRIKQAKDAFCAMMNKINKRLNRMPNFPHSADEQIPKFTFPPVDLTGNKSFQESCLKLWKEGVVSNETLLQTYGYDIGQETERKKKENSNGISDLMQAPSSKGKTEDSDKPKKKDPEKKERGRPEMTDDERKSDPASSATGKQPKPSNPEGSMKE